MQKILRNPLPTAATIVIAAVCANAQETVFKHPDDSRFWVAGQMNVILQQHDPFAARYGGSNSLRPTGERATSRVMTLFTGFQISRSSELLADVERASGGGISDALGLAGFTDLDVVRNPTLSHTPYVARAIYHKVFALGSATEKNDRNPMSVLTELPARRFEVRIGKMSDVDFFDFNSVLTDSHLQFMNWTIDNTGAYDYMADTRGYTWAAVAELHEESWSVRGAVGLMPTVANGMNYDHEFGRDRGQNLEFELRRRATTTRVLVYRNLARMGVYREALRMAAQSGTAPDITADDRPGRAKSGFVVNVEQRVTDGVRLATRIGWNNGQTESFAYTEVDNTIVVGGDTRVAHRLHDQFGIAAVSNGVSRAHRDFLAAGGYGFIIGDGALRYRRENIVETYYTAHVWRGVSIAGDLQWIRNPAYNRDRGPVLVRSVRMHIDL